MSEQTTHCRVLEDIILDSYNAGRIGKWQLRNLMGELVARRARRKEAIR